MDAKVQFNIYTVTPLGCTTSSQFTWKYIILHKYNITVFFQGYHMHKLLSSMKCSLECIFEKKAKKREISIFCTTNIYYIDGYS